MAKHGFSLIQFPTRTPKSLSVTVGVNNVVRVQIRQGGIRRRVLWWIGKNFSDELTASIVVFDS